MLEGDVGFFGGLRRPPQNDKLFLLEQQPVLVQSRTSPVELQCELELARIVRRCCLAGVAEQRADGGHVVLVGDVEHVGDQIHAEALGERNALRDTHVAEGSPRSDSGIAAEVAVELQQRRNFSRRYEAVDARLLEGSAGRELGSVDGAARRIDGSVGPSGQRRELQIVIAAGNDVERASGGDFEQRSPCPVAHHFAHESVARNFPRLIYATQHETVTLVEERCGAIEAGIVAVLRRERGFEIRRVVDGVRPSVRSEELVVAGEALAQVRAEAVIDRAAVGVVGVHVAKRHATDEG